MTTAKLSLVAKGGATAEDNDDPAAAAPQSGRFAISGGACESGFAAIWSRLLVEHVVLHTWVGIGHWSEWLPGAQTQSLDELKDVDIPWFGEDQFERRAFATFVSVVVSPQDDSGFYYQAEAVCPPQFQFGHPARGGCVARRAEGIGVSRICRIHRSQESLASKSLVLPESPDSPVDGQLSALHSGGANRKARCSLHCSPHKGDFDLGKWR